MTAGLQFPPGVPVECVLPRIFTGCCSIGVVHLEWAAVELAEALASSDGFLSRDLVAEDVLRRFLILAARFAATVASF